MFPKEPHGLGRSNFSLKANHETYYPLNWVFLFFFLTQMKENSLQANDFTYTWARARHELNWALKSGFMHPAACFTHMILTTNLSDVSGTERQYMVD